MPGRTSRGRTSVCRPLPFRARCGATVAASCRSGRRSGDLRPELLPTPQPDKVVAALLEELKITAVVVPLRDLGAIGAGTGPIVEVVVDMRSGQIHRSPVGCVARCDREVAWVGLRDHERPNGGIRS